MAKDLLIVVDVQANWAAANPNITQAIGETVDKKRGEMDILWIYHKYFMPGCVVHPDRATRYGGYSTDPKLQPVFTPHAEDWVMSKWQYNGFTNPALEKFLRRQNYDSQTIIGYKTLRCVFETARAAARLGFNPRIATDLVSGGHDIVRSAERLKSRMPCGVELIKKADLG